ncbi:hypothetical protein L484_008090 [Morus notabilis]|uniref:Uncharacterized protein n=1 Tax=Morus notabilis TaxID=981085 RepID=W9R2Y9_9ROSA|nr:hypothetical protein L484_008090 [Morus notabilis]
MFLISDERVNRSYHVEALDEINSFPPLVSSYDAPIARKTSKLFIEIVLSLLGVRDSDFSSEEGVSDTRSGSNVEVVNVDCMNANDGNRQGYHANKEREIKKRGAMDYCV